jgi:hypothetical protein
VPLVIMITMVFVMKLMIVLVSLMNVAFVMEKDCHAQMMVGWIAIAVGMIVWVYVMVLQNSIYVEFATVTVLHALNV